MRSFTGADRFLDRVSHLECYALSGLRRCVPVRMARRRGCDWRAIKLRQLLNGLQLLAFGSSIRLHRTGWK